MHFRKSGGLRNLVKQSERLNFPNSCAIRIAVEATDSRTLWYATILCFFCKVDCGMVALVTTLLLSQKQFVGPLIGIPIMRNLYRSASFISTAIFKATNSLPNTLDSIVFCRFEYHVIGAPFTKNIMPVVQRRKIN